MSSSHGLILGTKPEKIFCPLKFAGLSFYKLGTDSFVSTIVLCSPCGSHGHNPAFRHLHLHYTPPAYGRIWFNKETTRRLFCKLRSHPIASLPDIWNKVHSPIEIFLLRCTSSASNALISFLRLVQCSHFQCALQVPATPVISVSIAQLDFQEH